MAAATKKRSSGGGNKKKPPAPKKSERVEDADDDEDDSGVTLIAGDDDEEEGEADFDDDDSWFEDIGGDDESGGDDGGGALLALTAGDAEDAALADPAKRVLTDGASWGPAALDAARRVIEEDPQLGEAGVSLYAFRVLQAGGRVDVRLDSAADAYGSPSMAEIELFARAFGAALEHAIGVDAADQVAVEVSSPGAERALDVPADLRRFAGLPLRVEYRERVAGAGAGAGAAAAAEGEEDAGGGGGGASPSSVKTTILRIVDDGSGPIDEEGAEEGLGRGKAPRGGKAAAAGAGAGAAAGAATRARSLPPPPPPESAGPGETLWRLADVKANAPTKGRGLTRKQRDQRLRIALEDIVSCRIHVEF
jgi:ribosome maturation factor RimP